MASLLELRSLSKDFDGFKVLRDLSFSLEKKSLYGLIGPNGAGKSTLFNLISRFNDPSSGEILFKGKSINKIRAHECPGIGLARTFQISSLFSSMSVRENILVALDTSRKKNRDFWRPHLTGRYSEKTDKLLEDFSLKDLADKRVSDLSYGSKKILELASTSVLEPELLLLDEPLAGLGLNEIPTVKMAIKKAAIKSCLFVIDHNMHFIRELCDEILVLNRGQIIARASFEELTQNPVVLQAYLGENNESKS